MTTTIDSQVQSQTDEHPINVTGDIGSIARGRSHLILPGFIVLVVVSLMILHSPLFVNSPHRDSGYYLYTAQQMLQGESLYLDLWDHKPPMIFFINVVGLIIGGGTRWGIWLLEVVALSIAAILSFLTLRRAYSTGAAIAATLIWIFGLSLLIEGNQTEDFALPLQFAAIYLFFASEKRGRYSWRGYLLGLCLGLAFFLRPNLVGVGFALIIYYVLQAVRAPDWRSVESKFITVGLGGTTVISVMVVYFAFNGSVMQMFDAAIVYNMVYSDTAMANRIATLEGGLRTIALSGLPFFAIIGWGVGLTETTVQMLRKIPSDPLLSLALIALPIELLLGSMSGRLYGHYYIAWLPVMCILTGYFLHLVVTGVQQAEGDENQTPAATAVIVTFIVVALVSPLQTYVFDINRAINSRELDTLGSFTARLLRENTAEDETVLVWGAEPQVYFMAERRAPSRFYTHFLLLLPDYQRPELSEEFLSDLQENPPTLVVDTTYWQDGNAIFYLFPPIEAERREEWKINAANQTPYHPDWRYFNLTPELEESLDFIDQNYTLVREVDGRWRVYRLNGE